MNYLTRFVTAKLKGVDDCRQGVVIRQTARTLTILGESGETYACDPDHVTAVPLASMWGETRAFAIKEGVTE